MKRLILWLPLGIFLLLVGTVAYRMTQPKDETMPSRLIGQPLPPFALAPIVPTHAGFASKDFAQGEPRMINIFGSWCAPCALEVPQLLELKRRGIPIDAIAVRDRSDDVALFLKRYGDPFARIGNDPATQVQFALGSAGVPETFVIDGKGIIRHQHIGYLRPEDVPALIAAYEAAR